MVFFVIFVFFFFSVPSACIYSASGLKNSPRHSALYATQSEFYSCLVGAYYKKRYGVNGVGKQPVIRFLDWMGLERLIAVLLEDDETKNTATIHETFEDEESLEDLELSPEEQIFVAKALHVAGMQFGWISKVLG